MIRIAYGAIALINFTASLYCGWVVVRGPFYGGAMPSFDVLLVCLVGVVAALLLALYAVEQFVACGKGTERVLTDEDHPGPGPRGN